ncbi:MAG: acetate/propionate family kinase [Thermoanaerobaculia bacterium]
MPAGVRLGGGVEHPVSPAESRRDFEKILEDLASAADGLLAVGHRVVHGGEAFRETAEIDDKTLEAIRSLSPLAPIHNPVNVAGIEIARRVFPQARHFAVFDTAFHRTLPARAFLYALPAAARSLANVRRFGFHGISYSFVARRAAAFLDRPAEELNFIVLHLGGGASAAAIRGGQSVDTSMGMTPLEGLVMGTRPGDLDPALPLRLARELALTPDDVERALEEESGLRGLAGSSDVREVLRRASEGDDDARLAADLYVYRIKKYVGAYLAVLGRVDAIVFTGGVGENSAEIRARSLEGLERLGIAVDAVKNAPGPGGERAVGVEGMEVSVLVIPTDEELQIAVETAAGLEGKGGLR